MVQRIFVHKVSNFVLNCSHLSIRIFIMFFGIYASYAPFKLYFLFWKFHYMFLKFNYMFLKFQYSIYSVSSNYMFLKFHYSIYSVTSNTHMFLKFHYIIYALSSIIELHYCKYSLSSNIYFWSSIICSWMLLRIPKMFLCYQLCTM